MKKGESLFEGTFLLFFSPLLGLYRTLSNNNHSKIYLKWMLTIFATFYASTFNMEGIGDGTRHWQHVYDYYVDLDFSQFSADLSDILLFRTNDNVNEDVYIHVLSYLTGAVLQAPGLFFVFVGFIYGYFFSASMVKVFNSFPSFRHHTAIFILAIYFIAILNLQSMNTVRTWTGFWILFYGVLQYHQTRKFKYLLLLCLPPFIHVAYFVMALPVYIALFLPLRRVWLIALYSFSFLGTFFTPQAAMKELQQYQVGQEKVEAYTIEEKESIEQRFEIEQDRRWYRAYKRSGILSWAMVGITLVFILNGDYLRRMDSIEGKLFAAGLLSKALSNNAWFLFALDNRSDVISSLFILAAIIIYWQREYNASITIPVKIYLKPIYLSSLALIIPYFVYELSNTIEYLSFYVLFLPFLPWIDEGVNFTVREFLGYLFNV